MDWDWDWAFGVAGAWASKDFRVFVIWPMGFWICLKSRVPPTQPHGARAKKAKRREGKAKIQDPREVLRGKIFVHVFVFVGEKLKP